MAEAGAPASGSSPLALVRPISSRIGECELTCLERHPIDLERARRQHQAYQDALRVLGCELRALPALDHHPDGVFVEDTAVVLDAVAILCRPGAESRRGEVASVKQALESLRPLAEIHDPGTLDGGDVLVVGDQVLVGCTERSNAEGRRQLRDLVQPHGYALREVPVSGCLHLKTAVTAIDEHRLLLNPDWLDREMLAGFELVLVDPAEPFAANLLRIGDGLLADAHSPCTLERLRERGLEPVPVDNSELARAEGGLTCCSLIVRP